MQSETCIFESEGGGRFNNSTETMKYDVRVLARLPVERSSFRSQHWLTTFGGFSSWLFVRNS